MIQYHCKVQRFAQRGLTDKPYGLHSVPFSNKTMNATWHAGGRRPDGRRPRALTLIAIPELLRYCIDPQNLSSVEGLQSFGALNCASSSAVR